MPGSDPGVEERRAPGGVGLVYHPFFLEHRPGPGHPEQPQRLRVILEALDQAGLSERLTRLVFDAATPEQLALVHEPAYVDLLRLASEQGFGHIGDPDTKLCKESYDVAALAAGGVLKACDAVATGELERVFCAVRPPGHHAESDHAMGFCLLNHVALGAAHLVRNRGFERVAIVDLDVHHGNGTQHIFEQRADVLYVSLHEHPGSLPFPGSGYRNEVGRGAGHGATVNLFLHHGCSGAHYLQELRSRVLPVLDRFAPQFLLLSTGFDAQCTESIAHLNLQPEHFTEATRDLLGVAARHCRGRLVSVLEGGYELGGLGRCAAAHVAALLEGADAAGDGTG